MEITYGEQLAFRGFTHAPTREIGVVCLFGAVAAELGFLVEGFGARFPDCEAKRLVVEPEGVARWERCRIEFEFRSRNFETHGHAAEGVDLIVCWEHNWPEAPVDVLELRSLIAAIKAAEADGGRFAISKMFYKGGAVKWAKRSGPEPVETIRAKAVNSVCRGR